VPVVPVVPVVPGVVALSSDELTATAAAMAAAIVEIVPTVNPPAAAALAAPAPEPAPAPVPVPAVPAPAAPIGMAPNWLNDEAIDGGRAEAATLVARLVEEATVAVAPAENVTEPAALVTPIAPFVTLM